MPIGLDTIEPARIEAGLIIYSTDYTPGEHTPYDVCLDRMVAIDSTVDFVGKPALVALADAPPRRFKTLRLEGAELPDAGAAVLAGGAVVGTLSSPVDSPTYGPIGLAMLETAHAPRRKAGVWPVGRGTVAATVAPLSTAGPDKKSPRC